MASNERNYGIDSLRIVSMFMIVMLHVLGAGGILAKSVWGTAHYFAAWGVENLILCAVNCYALISGFVGVYSKFKPKNIVSLWFQVEFYSLGIAVALYLLAPGVFGTGDLVKSALPVLFERYWYFSAYFCMFFFMPFMNRFVLEAPKDLQKKFLALCFVLLAVLPTIVDEDVFHSMNGYSALWLAVMYILGAYMRHHGAWLGKSKLFCVSVFAVAVGCNLLAKYGLAFLSIRLTGSESIHTNVLLEYTSPTIIVASVMLLILFSRIKWGACGAAVVKVLAPLTFGVYLVHMQPMVWQYLGEAPFSWILEQPVYKATLLFIGLVVGIYVSCSAIEFIRRTFFKILRVSTLENLVSEKISALCRRLLAFF